MPPESWDDFDPNGFSCPANYGQIKPLAGRTNLLIGLIRPMVPSGYSNISNWVSGYPSEAYFPPVRLSRADIEKYLNEAGIRLEISPAEDSDYPDEVIVVKVRRVE